MNTPDPHLERAGELLALTESPGTLDDEVPPLALTAIGHALLGLQSTLSHIAADLRAHHAASPTSPEVLDLASPPGTPEFDEEVEDLAVRLWETDQTLQTAARSFSDDYQVIQDRYRDQAQALLDPDSLEGDDHRR